MLTLTKMKRAYIIDHIMPSDLDNKNIKNGLYLKEKMIKETTDDYIKSIIPNWKEIEREYRKNGLTEYAEKIYCGEMTLDQVPKPGPVHTDCWIRWKEFKQSDYDSDPNYGRKDYDYPIDSNDGPRNGYSKWVKEDEFHQFNFEKLYDVVFQMQIVIYGDNHQFYFPYQDYEHTNGWFSAPNEVDFYDFEAGSLTDPKFNPFTRLFFRNKKGYGDPSYKGWHWEDLEWFKENYPDLVKDNKVNATTILCDPFRVKYTFPPETEVTKGSYAIIPGRQWIKCKKITPMVNLCSFKIIINNFEDKVPIE